MARRRVRPLTMRTYYQEPYGCACNMLCIAEIPSTQQQCARHCYKFCLDDSALFTTALAPSKKHIILRTYVGEAARTATDITMLASRITKNQAMRPYITSHNRASTN